MTSKLISDWTKGGKEKMCAAAVVRPSATRRPAPCNLPSEPRLPSHRAALLREKAAEQASAAGERTPRARRTERHHLLSDRWHRLLCAGAHPLKVVLYELFRAVTKEALGAGKLCDLLADAELVRAGQPHRRGARSRAHARPPLPAPRASPRRLASPRPPAPAAASTDAASHPVPPLRQVPPSSVPTLQSNLADVCWFMGLELGESADAEAPKKLLVVLIQDLMREKVVPGELLKARLEPDMLQDVGLIKDKLMFSKSQVRMNTQQLYTQQKYNLFREQSEGYSKLITELSELPSAAAAGAGTTAALTTSTRGCKQVREEVVADIHSGVPPPHSGVRPPHSGVPPVPPPSRWARSSRTSSRSSASSTSTPTACSTSSSRRSRRCAQQQPRTRTRTRESSHAHAHAQHPRTRDAHATQRLPPSQHRRPSPHPAACPQHRRPSPRRLPSRCGVACTSRRVTPHVAHLVVLPCAGAGARRAQVARGALQPKVHPAHARLQVPVLPRPQQQQRRG